VTDFYDHVVVGLGALGSATCRELARRGHSVLGLERFALGHVRGASHDSSRILRHSYHTPHYVRLTVEAYDDWARLERETGEAIVTVVGGLDLFPPDAAIGLDDYTSSLEAVGVPFELLDVAAVSARWPQFALPSGTAALFQERSAIVPAARGTRLLQERAAAYGAVLRDHVDVAAVHDLGSSGIQVETSAGAFRCERLVVCADAWTNDVLAGVGHQVPLEVTLEQVTYFAPDEPRRFSPDRMPLWIWMDDPSFYGFPCYGEPTVKAAQDCGGPTVDPSARGFEESAQMRDRLAAHLRRMLPGSGEPVRSVRCLYTLTPDRDFVLGPVPGHPGVVVGMGAAHGFKFAPTFGRLLADLATDAATGAVDLDPFRLDRPALTDPDYVAHWLV
jgi:sarcosine oxidase